MLNGDPKLGLRSKRRRAVSSVLSALLLSAVVIAVGGAIWAFSQGAMTITAEDYAESMIEMTDTISERFIIEQVGYVSSELHVWVFNYGDVDIEFKVEIGDNTWPEDWRALASKDMGSVPLTEFSPDPGVELNIRIYSRRGNDAYYRFIVP